MQSLLLNRYVRLVIPTVHECWLLNFEIEAFVVMLLVARWDELNWAADLFERKEA